MTYESRYERFEARTQTGEGKAVQFKKAGFLARGDWLELHFFEVNGDEVVVEMSGTALSEIQSTKRYLSREGKIDLAGLALKRRIDAGQPLNSQEMYLRAEELRKLAEGLGLEW